MSSINMDDVMNKLSEKRPIFHSEADFQHSLAWEIHELRPDLNIRLEKREEIKGEPLYLDIFIFNNDKDEVYALELKYKTKRIDVIHNDKEHNYSEKYHLKNQGAHPISRYDFCKDIERLEKVVKNNPNAIGFAIFLTNDKLYWKKPNNNSSHIIDEDFRIHEDEDEDKKILKGTLRWRGASPGTTKKREKPIKLAGEYAIEWKNYSDVKDECKERCKYSRFRYLLVKVEHGNGI